MSLSRTHRVVWLGLMIWLGLPFAAQAGLRDFDGQERSLSEYTGSGKWLVVMIWVSDCHVCNGEAYQYVDFHDMHQEDNAAVLGISMDGRAGMNEAAAFIDRHSVSFPNLIGGADDVARLYTRLTGTPFVGTPSILIFDPSGQLRARQAGAVPTSVIEEFIHRETARVAEP